MPQNQKETAAPKLWVANHADYLFNYAISRVNDEELARDLVQDTFLAALKALTKFEGKSTERTWLTSILKFKIIDVYRKKSSALLTKIEDESNDEKDFFDEETGHWNEKFAPQAFGFTSSDLLEKKEFNQILQFCLDKLPNLWMSVFTMKHLDDEESEFICKELKITSSNYWVIMHRAKINLRECLQKRWM